MLCTCNIFEGFSIKNNVDGTLKKEDTKSRHGHTIWELERRVLLWPTALQTGGEEKT